MDLERLSLEDQSEGGAPLPVRGRYHYPTGSFSNFPHPSKWQRDLFESLGAPFVELPAELLDSLESYGLKMGLGFRFRPGQQHFLLQELRLPRKEEKLKFMSSSLGVSYYTAPLKPHATMPIHGIKELAGRDTSKVLVEVLTYFSGKYGRILVLVTLGIGCTAWFSFIPIEGGLGPTFSPIECEDPFFDLNYVAPGFRKLHFTECQNVAENVAAMLEKDTPFTELEIPASGPTMRAVGLGIMIAFFLAVGIVPDCTSALVSSCSA